MLVTTDDPVDAPRELACEPLVVADLLMGEADDELGPLALEIGEDARDRRPAGREVVPVLHPGAALVGESQAEDPDADAAQLQHDMVFDVGEAVGERAHAAVGGALQAHVRGNPGEMRLGDAVGEQRELRIVELVVARGDEEMGVVTRVAVEEIERLDHRRALQVLAHHRGEEEVAGVQHQHRPALTLELSAEGADPGEAAFGAGAQPFDLVGVVDLQNGEAGSGLGGHR